MGVYENRLDYRMSILDTYHECASVNESRIKDLDMAKEMVKLSKINLLSQSAQSLSLQARQQPEQLAKILMGQ